MGPSRTRSSLLAVAPLFVAGTQLLVGCAPATPPEGTLGEERVAYFQSVSDFVFRERLLVGSRFFVSAEARAEDDRERVSSAALTSSDAAIATVTLADGPDEGDEADELLVEMVGAGEAHLVLTGEDGEEIDRILVRAAVADRIDLLDGKILGSSVDARLPDELGLLEGGETFFALAATDKCGGALLSVGAVEVTVSDEAVLALSTEEGIVYDAEALAPGEVELVLTPAVGEAQTFAVTVVEPALIDDVEIEIAAAKDNQAELWGRAFAGSLEVVGLDYAWDATPRVTVSPDRGPNTIATISVPREGEPADDRPAVVDIEAHGEDDSVDLFALRSDAFVTARVPPVDEPAPTGPSCGAEACNPYGVALVGAMFLGRLRRRSRRGSDD